MIQIANDKGVGTHLAPKFTARHIPFRLVNQQPSADFVFSGCGPDGLDHMITIGIERKTMSDLIGSMHSGRLTAKQVPKMLEWFDYSYLLVEGTYKCGPLGELHEWMHGGWQSVRGATNGASFDKITHFLMTISLFTHGRVMILQSPNMDQTAALVGSVYEWFQTPWEEHGSFQRFHSAPPDRPFVNTPTEKDGPEAWKHWNCRLWAKEVKGIGWDKSLLVADHFKTTRKAVTASTKDWLEIKGIGPKLAKAVDEAL